MFRIDNSTWEDSDIWGIKGIYVYRYWVGVARTPNNRADEIKEGHRNQLRMAEKLGDSGKCGSYRNSFKE